MGRLLKINWNENHIREGDCGARANEIFFHHYTSTHLKSRSRNLSQENRSINYESYDLLKYTLS